LIPEIRDVERIKVAAVVRFDMLAEQQYQDGKYRLDCGMVF